MRPLYRRRRYVASLYWAITTMSTVGYGDIVPVNTAERIFAISAMVLRGQRGFGGWG